MSKPLVVLDSNILILPLSMRLNISEAVLEALGRPAEIVVPDFILGELEYLEKRHGHQKYRFALSLAKQFKVLSTKTPRSKHVDNALLDLCLEKKAILATNDSRLKRRANKAGIRVLGIRGRHSLQLE